ARPHRLLVRSVSAPRTACSIDHAAARALRRAAAGPRAVGAALSLVSRERGTPTRGRRAAPPLGQIPLREARTPLALALRRAPSVPRGERIPRGAVRRRGRDDARRPRRAHRDELRALHGLGLRAPRSGAAAALARAAVRGRDELPRLPALVRR